MKPLVVGEAPGRRGDGEPLAGKIGRRLASLCGITLEEFLARFDRVNVLPDWPGSNGKGSTFPLLRGARMARDRVLPLLPGRDVVVFRRAAYALERALVEDGHADARDLSFSNFVWHPVALAGGATRIAVSPHPSGVSRWWNDPENIEEVARFYRTLTSRIP